MSENKEALEDILRHGPGMGAVNVRAAVEIVGVAGCRAKTGTLPPRVRRAAVFLDVRTYARDLVLNRRLVKQRISADLLSIFISMNEI